MTNERDGLTQKDDYLSDRLAAIEQGQWTAATEVRVTCGLAAARIRALEPSPERSTYHAGKHDLEHGIDVIEAGQPLPWRFGDTVLDHALEMAEKSKDRADNEGFLARQLLRVVGAIKFPSSSAAGQETLIKAAANFDCWGEEVFKGRAIAKILRAFAEPTSWQHG